QEPFGSLCRPIAGKGRAEEDRERMERDHRPDRPQQAQEGPRELQVCHADTQRSGLTGRDMSRAGPDGPARMSRKEEDRAWPAAYIQPQKTRLKPRRAGG